jgi:DNA-binding NarL/FixJ family response regulator
MRFTIVTTGNGERAPGARLGPRLFVGTGVRKVLDGPFAELIDSHPPAVKLLITPSDRAMLQLLADGKEAHAIADRLGIAANELDARLTKLFAKLGAASRSEAVATAARRGLVVHVPETAWATR